MGSRSVFLVVLLGASRLPAQPATAGPLEFGTASGRPGETVLVPVHATFDHPLMLLFAPFVFDPERLEYLRYDVEGSEAAHLNPLSIGYRNYIPGEGSLGIFDTGVSSEGKVVPPGSRRHIGNLVFLVRAVAPEGEAVVKPVPHISSTAGGPDYSLIVDGTLTGAVPDALVEGSIDVLPPLGPRPIGRLACAQYLDRARLDFEPSARYDAIEVARNGSLVASLPGSSTSFMDSLPGVGSFRYALTGILSGERSVAAECEVLAVSPAAPPVKDFTCGETGLAWTNAAPYDRITILRDGAPIADLPGSAASFTDPARPETLTLYGVVAEVEGFRSPEAPCVDNGVWVLEAGDVQVPVDSELVLVPIYATTSSAAIGFGAHLDVQGRLTIVRDRTLSLGGTAVHPEADQFFSGMGFLGVPSMGVLFDGFPPREPEKDLAPGLRQLLAYFPLRPNAPASDGETVILSFRQGSFTVNRPVGGVASVNDAEREPAPPGGIDEPPDAAALGDRVGWRPVRGGRLGAGRRRARIAWPSLPPGARGEVNAAGDEHPRDEVDPGADRRAPGARQHFSYFQLRDLPSASHSRAVAMRRSRVSSRFASVIHSTYSRPWLGEKYSIGVQRDGGQVSVSQTNGPSEARPHSGEGSARGSAPRKR